MPKQPGSAPLVRNCSVERTLNLVSDAWSFLVLREFYMGARRFEQIQKILRLPRSTLSDRLKRLADNGLIERHAAGRDGKRFEYRLSEQGRDLYLVMLTMLRFGDDHLHGGEAPPLYLVHRKCGHRCRPTTLCSACRQPVTAGRVRFRDGPGAGRSPPATARQQRRSASEGAFERNRPSSVSRTLAILADRWTFLLIRELFFGQKRYDQFQRQLGIGPNILAGRLNRLVANGIVDRVRYSERPPRHEYRLSPMGRDLYLPLIQMLRWGDKWLGFPAPLILTHLDCGEDFHPVVACDHCGEDIEARNMRYDLNYALTEDDKVAARVPVP